MKHLMKKLTALFLATLMTLSLGAAWAGAEEQLTIGIIQFAEHSSLDNCREGFIAGLAEEGYVAGENVNFIEQNAQADMATVNQIGRLHGGAVRSGLRHRHPCGHGGLQRL